MNTNTVSKTTRCSLRRGTFSLLLPSPDWTGWGVETYRLIESNLWHYKDLYRFNRFSTRMGGSFPGVNSTIGALIFYACMLALGAEWWLCNNGIWFQLSLFRGMFVVWWACFEALERNFRSLLTAECCILYSISTANSVQLYMHRSCFLKIFLWIVSENITFQLFEHTKTLCQN